MFISSHIVLCLHWFAFMLILFSIYLIYQSNCSCKLMSMTQVGLELEKNFEGKASNLVASCGKSAEKLVTLVTRHFPGILILVLIALVTDMIVQMVLCFTMTNRVE